MDDHYDDLKVIISRDKESIYSAEYSVNKIAGVKWDRISGGVNKTHSGYYLYGYIPYPDAAELLADCSGQHDFGDNDAKIYISSANGKDPEYQEGYRMLLEKAGPKPSSSRRSSLPPCTKRILELAPITREELFKQLKSEGYTSYECTKEKPKNLCEAYRIGIQLCEGSG